MPFAFAARDAATVPLFLVEPDDLDAARENLDPPGLAWFEAHAFSGKLGETLPIPGADGAIVAALVGWGDAAARAKGRFHLAAAARALPAGSYRLETTLAPDEAEEAALGWLLEGYRFQRFRTAADAPRRLLAPPEGVDAERLLAIAEATAFGRDLVNTPANVMGPSALEVEARALAEAHGAQIVVRSGDELLDRNFPLIHAVGRAGAEPPRIIDMLWGERGAPKIAIVGKGVCFDTGGLDLKPATAMRNMKKDMGGAAAALALARMIMARRLRVRLRVTVPAVENAVSATSFRPGDILTSRKGLTVEVSNTDAEGRLVLADAMALVCEREPEILLDFATLTGAARVALGPDLPAMFTPDDALADELMAGAAQARDPLWRLPLWRPYEEDVASSVADLDNAPAGGFAGAITAALFLERFSEGARSWAHFDLFAWNPKAKPGRPMGGEVQAARAAFAMLEARYG